MNSWGNKLVIFNLCLQNFIREKRQRSTFIADYISGSKSESSPLIDYHCEEIFHFLSICSIFIDLSLSLMQMQDQVWFNHIQSCLFEKTKQNKIYNINVLSSSHFWYWKDSFLPQVEIAVTIIINLFPFKYEEPDEFGVELNMYPQEFILLLVPWPLNIC